MPRVSDARKRRRGCAEFARNGKAVKVAKRADKQAENHYIDDETKGILHEDTEIWIEIHDSESESDEDVDEVIDMSIDCDAMRNIREVEKRWREVGSNSGVRARGTSRSTYFRELAKRKGLERAAIGTAKINSYFTTQRDDTDCEEGNASSEDEDSSRYSEIMLKEAVTNLSAKMAEMSSKNRKTERQLAFVTHQATAILVCKRA